YISLSDARLSDAAWARIGRTRFAPALEALTVDGPAAASLQRHLTSFPRLANLALQDPSVTDAGLEKLHQLPDLHTLHFDGAGITDAALEQVPKLVKLNSLVLRNTRITDAGLAKLRTSPVRYLDLIGTGVTDDGLKHLTGLPQLLELRLLRTRVTNDGLAHLKDVPNLVMLNLHGRPITRKGLENLRECGNLQALYLHGVPVKDEDIEPLTECKRLTFLNVLCTNVGPKGFARLRTALPGCDIRWQPDPERTGAAVAQALGGEVGLRLDDDPERIEQYPPARPLPRGTFRVVSIARTSGTVGDNDFVVLQQLRHLESLELPRTKLDNGEVEELCDTLFAPKLRRLHLGAPITDRALVHFQRFRALTEFSLPCPNITDAGLEHLKALSTLRKLDLRGTKATVAGVKQLAAALPECRIESEHGVIEPAKK
ncbi:MAG TPA: hypothetical protein VKD72_33405, partial [Gemmataceae bacterium]|nr:hypothetical protein [Gemmataceae bacterium]